MPAARILPGWPCARHASGHNHRKYIFSYKDVECLTACQLQQESCPRHRRDLPGHNTTLGCLCWHVAAKICICPVMGKSNLRNSLLAIQHSDPASTHHSMLDKLIIEQCQHARTTLVRCANTQLPTQHAATRKPLSPSRSPPATSLP
jgi:hypothetical protein